MGIDYGIRNVDNWNMKTTIDIPDELLQFVRKHTASSTIRGAVIAALESYRQRARQQELIPHLGTFKDFMTLKELQEMREERDIRHDNRRQQLVDRNASRQRGSRSAVPRRKSA
jgi:putative antitoxin of VapBC-like toxin-antitoxin system